MTTLEEELGHSAYAYEKMAREARTVQDRADHYAFALRLRQRAAWVRELSPGPDSASPPAIRLYERLTGPIPSETAPAIAAAIDKTFEQDAGLLRRLADSPRPTPVQEAARMWREGETAPAASVGLVVPVCAAGCGRPVKGGDGTEALYCDEHAPAAPKEGTVKP